MVEIDYRQLAAETLDNLITEITLREGTDYGEVEMSKDTKKKQLMMSLVSGKAVIVFDAVHNYCDIITKAEVVGLNIHNQKGSGPKGCP